MAICRICLWTNTTMMPLLDTPYVKLLKTIMGTDISSSFVKYIKMERDHVYSNSGLTLGTILRMDISSESVLNNTVHPMQVLSFSRGKFVCKNFTLEKDVPMLSAIKTDNVELDKNSMNSDETEILMQHFNSNQGGFECNNENSHVVESIPKLIKLKPSHSKSEGVLRGAIKIAKQLPTRLSSVNVNYQQKSSILKGLLIQDMTKAKVKMKKCRWSSPRKSEGSEIQQMQELQKAMETNKCINAPLKCISCELLFTDQSQLKLHNICKHNKSQRPSLIDLTECGASLKGGNHFFDQCNSGLCKRHRFPCTECGCVLKSEYMLRRHLKKHQNSLDVYCVECDATFSGHAALRAHYATTLKHRDSTGFKFPCDKCSKRYQTAEELSKHEENFHERTVHFSCEQCGQGYASRQGLYTHVRKEHQGYRPPRSHMCHLCANSFTSKALLSNHMRTHTGEQPFECDRCHRKFSQMSSMRTHVKLVHLKMKRNRKRKGDPWGESKPEDVTGCEPLGAKSGNNVDNMKSIPELVDHTKNVSNAFTDPF